MFFEHFVNQIIIFFTQYSQVKGQIVKHLSIGTSFIGIISKILVYLSVFLINKLNILIMNFNKEPKQYNKI